MEGGESTFRDMNLDNQAARVTDTTTEYFSSPCNVPSGRCVAEWGWEEAEMKISLGSTKNTCSFAGNPVIRAPSEMRDVSCLALMN